MTHTNRHCQSGAIEFYSKLKVAHNINTLWAAKKNNDR